jgi:tetratricopeptide (TPR) repeat protein
VFTVAGLKRSYGIKPTLVAALVNAGVIKATRGPKGAYQLDFQDVVLLRSAAALAKSKVPPARLAKFLKVLRQRLPEDAPLSSVRVFVLGKELVVRIGDSLENVAGQLMLDFSRPDAPEPPKVERLEAIAEAADPPGRRARHAADDDFALAQKLEGSDPALAIRAYRRLLAKDPGCVDAALNLCALLIESDDAQGACRVAREALSHHPEHALLNYNLGVACEECEHFAEALTAYTHALASDPLLADAHFNAAQLHETLGNARDALRHMSAYRRLKRG